jgi:hypothetical protein
MFVFVCVCVCLFCGAANCYRHWSWDERRDKRANPAASKRDSGLLAGWSSERGREKNGKKEASAKPKERKKEKKSAQN